MYAEILLISTTSTNSVSANMADGRSAQSLRSGVPTWDASKIFSTICKPWNTDCLFHNLRLWIQHGLHDRKSTTLTMCCQLSSPRPAPVEPARPAQKGHQPPCGCTATVESTPSSRRLDLRDKPLRTTGMLTNLLMNSNSRT